MANRSLLPPSVETYLFELQEPETAIQIRLRAETSLLEQAGMQIGPDQGKFMAMMVKLIGAKNCLEIGTFTGYSALAVAMALPPAGKLICCDVSEEWTSMGRRYWDEAGVSRKIDLRLAPATDTLLTLIAEGGKNTFDFAFIDADKTAYDAYYEFCLELVRPNGIILLDNMLWSGKVADSNETDEDTVAIRDLNQKIRDDDRVDSCLLSVGDGIMMVRKR